MVFTFIISDGGDNEIEYLDLVTIDAASEADAVLALSLIHI